MKMGVFEVVDEKKCYDNGCKPLKLKWVGQDEGRKVPFESGLSGDQKGPRTETNNLEQKTYSHPYRRRKG